MRLVRVAPADPPYSSEDVKFQNGNVVLAGSLYIPKSGGLHPAIVFLHGSGPEVRWGANRFRADYFARRGIVALIYDKRGAGVSTGDWRKSDFNDLAGDALAAISLLCNRQEIDPKHIGIYGHSQGGHDCATHRFRVGFCGLRSRERTNRGSHVGIGDL